MSKVRRKITKYEIILGVLVLAVIVAGLLLPKTGELVLLDEFCNISESQHHRKRRMSV